MAFTVTVLGSSSGGVPPAGGAGSGYLLEAGGARLLADCGNGVLGNLARHARLADLAGVYVTHLHADHVQDLLPLALWARFTRRRLPVFGPEGLRTLCYRWFSLFHADPDAYVEALGIRELKPWETVDLPPFRLQAMPVEHNVPCLALRAEAEGALLVYTGDTKAGALVVEGAAGADLLLAEATYLEPEEGKGAERSRAHHMTAKEAAGVATAAKAKRLLLTHLLAHVDPERSLAEARSAFDGPVDVARVGERYVVGGSA